MMLVPVVFGSRAAGVDAGSVAFGHLEEQQRLAALLQWIQHSDHHPVLLRGHHPLTQSVKNKQTDQ